MSKTRLTVQDLEAALRAVEDALPKSARRHGIYLVISHLDGETELVSSGTNLNREQDKIALLKFELERFDHN